MLLLPAIDLLGGRCVRLLRGSFTDTTSYADDPVETAKGFADAGARWIHIVDLDAAAGKGADNLPVLERIRRAVGCRLEAGGGLRTAAQVDRMLALGVDRIVVGTVLVRSPAEVAAWAARHGPRIAAGIDARDGRVRVSGWTEDAGVPDLDVAGQLAGLGLRWLIYTSISRDGTLAGPDIKRTNEAAAAAGVPTLLSGGIGSERDVEAVAENGGSLCAGVILGRALYESRIDLGKLIRRFPQHGPSAWDP